MDDEACSFLPDSLQIFLKPLFTSKDGKMKVASIGQAIVHMVSTSIGPWDAVAPSLRI